MTRAGAFAMAVALCALVPAACADAPDSSQRPAPRATAPEPGASSPRPDARPASILRRAANAFSGKRDDAPSSVPGSICGSAGIIGKPIAPIPGRIRGCGVEQPVSVGQVAGVTLSRPATMDCPTARALEAWVADSVRPALGNVTRLEVAAHYSCRTRNNVAGAKISQHGKGQAIDISGFGLSDGSVVTVLNGWDDRRTGAALRRIHQGACGPFGTVLGPAADRHHRDHLHLDTARYRSGSYCR